MFGYNQQQYYGPWNALADITSAYMQKKNMDDAYTAAANFSDDADKQLQPKVAQVIPTTQTGQGLVNAAIKQLQPTALNSVADGVQQMAPTMSQLDGAGSSGFLTAAKQFASANPALPQNQGPAHTQSDYDAFAAAKAANPEWYVGDTYVGSDPAAKAAAQAKPRQQPATKGQYDFSNPMQQEYGFQDDKPMQQLSYQEQKAKINQFATSTMKNIVSKYGYETAQKVFPMIQQAMQDKLAGAADAIDTQNWKKLEPYLISDYSNTPGGLRKVLYEIENYNINARGLGKQGMDTALIGKLLDSGAVMQTKVDDGGVVHLMVSPKNVPMFDDGSYVKDINDIQKQTPPSVKDQLAQRMYEFTHVPAGTKYQTDRADARAAAAGDSGGSSSRITAAKGIITAFNSWVSSHKQALEAGEMKESDYPNYNNYQRAMQMLSQAAGIDDTGSSGDGGNSGGGSGKIPAPASQENSIYNALAANNPEASDAELKGYIATHYDFQ